MRVFACDPGGDSGTGYAVYDTETCAPLMLREHPDSEQEMLEYYNLMCFKWKPDVVVVEGFKLRTNQNVDLSSVYKLGVFRAHGREHHEVLPAVHKSAVMDKPLNKMFKQFGHPIGKGHARDALRLALFWASVKVRHKGTQELLQGQGEK